MCVCFVFVQPYVGDDVTVMVGDMVIVVLGLCSIVRMMVCMNMVTVVVILGRTRSVCVPFG